MLTGQGKALLIIKIDTVLICDTVARQCCSKKLTNSGGGGGEGERMRMSKREG